MKTISHLVKSLTVRAASGQTADRHRQNAMAGIGLPKTSGMNGRDESGFFVPSALVRSMAGRGGELKSSPMLVSVDQPKPDRHPLIGLSGRRGQTRLRAKPMATNPQGNTPALRPKSTQLIAADGSTGTITWIRRDSLVRRLRRHLAKKNHRLVISAEATASRDELGEYAVIGADGHPLQTHADLGKLARYLGVLADDELVEPPAGKGWVYQVAREHVEIVDGKRVRLRDRLTQDFRTEKAARKAAATIEDRAGIVIVGMDADDALAMRFEEEQQVRQAAALVEIDAAIEANPTLRHLRSEAGSERAWGAAVAFDLQLQNDPAWTQKPISDRLSEVARLLVANGLVSEVSL
jgi:hypothetical protein